MNSEDREAIVQRWERVLSELADIDHLKVTSNDPVKREDELLAELRELEWLLTGGEGE